MRKTATAAVLPLAMTRSQGCLNGERLLLPIAPAAPPSDPIVVFQAVDVATRLVELLVEATTFIVRNVSVGSGSALIGRDACLLVAKQAIFVPRELARAAGGLRAAPLGRATPTDVVRVVVAVVMGARDSGSRYEQCRGKGGGVHLGILIVGPSRKHVPRGCQWRVELGLNSFFKRRSLD